MQRKNTDTDAAFVYFIQGLDKETLKKLYIRAPEDVRELLDSEEVLSILASKEDRKADSFLDFMSPIRSRGTVSRNCTAFNSSDLCVRKAAESDEAELVQTFLDQGATDILGSLVEAAENGADEAIRVLSPFCTERMFDIAATNAAYGGHEALMIELYSSGTQSQTTKDSILRMAIRGGQPGCAHYILARGAKLTSFETNFLGKNLEQMLPMFRGMRFNLSACSIASFGGPEDYRYALRRNPTLFETDSFTALVCALENNNDYFISLLSKEIGESVNFQRLYQAASTGGNERMILKYAKKADRLLYGIYIAIANGNIHLAGKLLQIRKLSIPNAPYYAGYSGSGETVTFVVKALTKRGENTTEEPDIEVTKKLAIGAAAGGNYEQLKNYTIALDDYADYTQYFAEALKFSRYNLFEQLYADCKDLFPQEEVRNHIEKAENTKSLLSALSPGETLPILKERVNTLLRRGS